MAAKFTSISKNVNGSAVTGFAAYKAKLHETAQIARDDSNGELVFAFSANSERGAGGQVIPVDQVPAVLEYLNDVAANGIPDADGGVLATVRNSIKIEDGFISFRTTDGQGAKPMKITVGAFPQVVNEIAQRFNSYLPVIQEAMKK
jgi:hypothetical protein